MSPKKLKRADRPTVKAWVSKPGEQIDLQSINNLQKSFGNRLNVTRGQNGETIVAYQPQDKKRLEKIMDTCSLFSEQSIYADLPEDA